mmetsp:Transcript_71309/g.113009  ORF Transcript_71309/g.113009 Transcript_71309/m.113009 type:complete len:125 (+) Transcript_71309:1180-1554(+)
MKHRRHSMVRKMVVGRMIIPAATQSDSKNGVRTSAFSLNIGLKKKKAKTDTNNGQVNLINFNDHMAKRALYGLVGLLYHLMSKYLSIQYWTINPTIPMTGAIGKTGEKNSVHRKVFIAFAYLLG